MGVNVFLKIIWGFFSWLPWPWIIFGGEVFLGGIVLFAIAAGVFYWFWKYRERIFFPDPILIKEFWPPDEGSMNFYYGKIRNGKSYAATCDVLEDLERGQVIYADWIVKWDGIDERKMFWPRFMYWLGRYQRLYVIPKENFNFIHILRAGQVSCSNDFCVDKIKNHFRTKQEFLTFLSTLTDCKIYLDEAYKYISSYTGTRIDEQLQSDILSTGHMDRTLNVIAQRPTSVHVTLRGNVNRFYKCTKVFDMFGIKLFLREEFQDMADETVNDEVESDSWKLYFGAKKIYKAYNTKWMRQGIPDSQENKITAWK